MTALLFLEICSECEIYQPASTRSKPAFPLFEIVPCNSQEKVVRLLVVICGWESRGMEMLYLECCGASS